MKFSYEPRPPGYQYPVLYETDEIRLCVGYLSPERGKWGFHHVLVTAALKPATLNELRAWAKDQCQMIELTQRMLK